MNKYFHICGSGAFLRLLFLFSRLLALPAPCPYRAEQATGFAGGYDYFMNFGFQMRKAVFAFVFR